MTDLIKPAKLAPGDTICFISPSGRLNDIFPDRIDRARKFLEDKGYKVNIRWRGPLPTNDFQQGILQRVAEVHAAFEDTSVKCIVTSIGGLSVNEILPYLDFDLIRRNPKILCGYSDITLLHQAIFTQSRLHTFYGPAIIPQFGEYPKPLDFTVDAWEKAVTRTSPVGELHRSKQWTDEWLDWSSEDSSKRARKMKPSSGWHWLRKGNAKGRLMGGCLPSCAQLFATKYRPNYKGTILFLELPDAPPEPEGSMSPDYARSCLADYALAGILDEVVGIVFGRPLRYSDEETKEFEQALLDQCRHTDYPILANIDIGHTDPMLTLPFGVMAEIDSERDRFELLESGVS